MVLVGARGRSSTTHIVAYIIALVNREKASCGLEKAAAFLVARAQRSSPAVIGTAGSTPAAAVFVGFPFARASPHRDGPPVLLAS